VQQNFLDGTPCGGGGRCDNVSLWRFEEDIESSI
jgi:hypothetical protein